MPKTDDKKKDPDVESAQKKLAELKEFYRSDGEHVVLNIFPAEVKKLDALLNSGRYSYTELPKIACEVDILKPKALQNGVIDSDKKNPEEPPAKRRKPTSDGGSTSTTSSHSTQSTTASLDQSYTDKNGGTKVLTFSCGSVPVNTRMVEMIDEIKPMLRDAVEYFNRVKVWIVLLIPKMEDGNNFGVSIQLAHWLEEFRIHSNLLRSPTGPKISFPSLTIPTRLENFGGFEGEEVLGEVRSVESDSAAYSDQLSRYFLSRGRMITKVARYPHVDDYRRAITDIDERQFINMRLVLIEMRNHYTTMHDLITKNLEKIRKPRNSNMEHMY